MSTHLTIKNGDLLDQPVEVIVNAWNRNLIPWWLLLPQGVSGAIKRRGGHEPFRELARKGVLRIAPVSSLPGDSLRHNVGTLKSGQIIGREDGAE